MLVRHIRSSSKVESHGHMLTCLLPCIFALSLLIQMWVELLNHGMQRETEFSIVDVDFSIVLAGTILIERL